MVGTVKVESKSRYRRDGSIYRRRVVRASIRIRGVQHQTAYSILKHGIKKAIRLARRWLAQKRREARSA